MEKESVTFADLEIGQRFCFYGKVDRSYIKIDTNTFVDVDSSGRRYGSDAWVRVLAEMFPIQSSAKIATIEINVTDDEIKYLTSLKTEFLVGPHKTLAEKLKQAVKPKIVSVGIRQDNNTSSMVTEMIYSGTVGWVAFTETKLMFSQSEHPNGLWGYEWPEPPEGKS
jgi:hypothetical protein